MKMSEVFDLPVYESGCDLKDNHQSGRSFKLAMFGDDESAKFAARAINNHDPLVECLRNIVELYGNRHNCGLGDLMPVDNQTKEIADAMKLLSKLEGE